MPSIQNSLSALENWFEMNPYSGYDPFDVKGHKWILPIQKYALSRKPVNLFIELAPRFTRMCLGIKPTINFKGLALIAHAYLHRYASSNDPRYLNKAKEYLDYLIEHAAGNESWSGWGYPFDWQSKILIPAYTPSVVVSVFVGESLLLYRELASDTSYDASLAAISRFILTQLKIRETGSGVCFSYTPLDDFYVHNANLFAAYYLVTTGHLFDEPGWIEMGLKATSYTLADQQLDGGFSYWGSEHQVNHIDNFHTGYVLRMLHRLQALEPQIATQDAILRGHEYYVKNLFSEGLPLHSLGRSYPIDIHTLNEVLLVHSELVEFRTQTREIFDRTLEYLLHQMQSQGGFHYKHYRFFKNRMPFFRWVQAWTFYALAQIENEGLTP